MFLTVKRSGCDYSGQQFTSGKFLILMTNKNEPVNPVTGEYAVRAIVRFVAMHQLGHFMMGTARIGRKSITLSGTYGNNGLLCDVDTDTFNHGTPLPDELYQQWAHSTDGWNSAGSEGPSIRQWAKANLL